MEHILFLTGRLAQPALERVLAGMADAPFTWEVREIGLQVAALMTADMVRRRLTLESRNGNGNGNDTGVGLDGGAGTGGPGSPCRPDRIIVPGRCRGDVEALGAHFGVPVERGPEELKDLPRHFRRAGRPVDLSRYAVSIFAEIVDAPRLSVEAIVARGLRLAADGADVIDLGCLPATPFPHLEDSVRALKAAGLSVSVDSLDTAELLRGGRAGCDHLLSLTIDTLWVADEVAAVPVLIPREPADTDSLDAAIDAMRAHGKPFLADAILDPIPFGLAASIVRFHRLRARYPDIALMMGVGNVTELTEADTSGINAVLFGIAAELGIAAVLTTEVSPHARRAVREADVARRLMHAADTLRMLPKGLTDALMTVHAKSPFPDTPEEIEATAQQVRDPNFRVQISPLGIHVYNRDGHRLSTDAFALWPQLGLEKDAGHAFYMGVELARAEVAWQLGKRYVQDQPLDWGVAFERADDDKAAWCAPGTTRATPAPPLPVDPRSTIAGDRTSDRAGAEPQDGPQDR